VDTRTKAAILAILTCLLWSAQSHAGPLFVEEAEIARPGSCKVQSWASLAGRYGFLGAVAAGCGVNVGRPVEFELEFERERSGREWGSEVEIEVKTALWKADNVAVAIQGGSAFDLTAGSPESTFLRTLVSVEFTDQFQLNLNVGWRYEAEERLHWAIYGAGFEWKLAQPLALVGEIFGQVGHHDSEQRYSSKARSQLGLRYRPTAQLRFDLLYGNNIMGSGGNWLTLGATFRPSNPN
jgi:hypothetical protein